MYTLGVDLGTTSISFCVLDASGVEVFSESTAQNRFLPAKEPYERTQDAELTVRIAQEGIERLSKRFSPVCAIGITGQMHGILYVDAQGRTVSPLYTWQDGRGDIPLKDGQTACAQLTRETGLPFAPGFGLATHRFNVLRGLVPETAARMTTMGGYLAMRLTGRKRPLLHASDAASLGGWNVREGRFMPQEPMLPEATGETLCAGYTPDGVPVSVCLGDNQASFLGSVGRAEDTLLLNIGTGSQLSAFSPRFVEDAHFETRPYLNGTYLLAGCALCGGRAYADLERFFRECVSLFGGTSPDSLYDMMNRLAQEVADGSPLSVDTRLCGTRENPGLTGSIQGITEANCTPAHLVQGVLRGIVEELYGFFGAMEPHLSAKPARLVGAGSALARNAALCRMAQERFKLPLALSTAREAAARGAALFAKDMH